MAIHANLVEAKRAKNDEFYTRREDIENELSHYAEHFRGKVVYCNCDDPVESEFWKFFVRNFKPWGLKKLMATHYEPDEKNFSYSLELTEDTNGDGKIDWHDEPTIIQLPCNGDFRSAACIELLKEADIVVTNPPFSLFREYVAQLIEYGKKFIILGNQNAITYKEFFPLLKDNQVWIGYSSNKTMVFRVPDGYKYDPKLTAMMADGYHYGKVPAISWFTNLDIPKRHAPIDLRGNYYDPAMYPKYDNYDAINVDRVDDIPCDYNGVMGVPITFMDKYCPEQFQVVGLVNGKDNLVDINTTRDYKAFREMRQDGTETGSNGKKINGNPVLQGKPTKGNYFLNGNEYVHSTYARIFIRNKHPTKGAVVV